MRKSILRFSRLSKIAALGVLLAFGASSAARAARVTLSPGVRLPVRLDNDISTKSGYHYFGNVINATLDSDVLDSRGRVALAAGSAVQLSMPVCKRAGHLMGRAQIRLRLFSVAAPGGEVVPLDGYATRLDNNKKPGREGTFHGNHSLVKDAAVDTTAMAVGAGAGLAVGGPLGLPIGAGAGVLVAGLWTAIRRGPDLVLPAGTVIEFTLGRPAGVDEPEVMSSSIVTAPQDPVSADAGGGAWGQGLALPPSADLVAMLDEQGDPAAMLAALGKIDFRNRSNSDRVFGTYLRGVAELNLNHPKRALTDLERAYAGAKRLNMPQEARQDIARNLVLALESSSKDWQASPLMNDPTLQAVLVTQEGGA